jgi:hypothetical protein
MAIQRLREAPCSTASSASSSKGGAGLAAIAAGGLSVGGIGSDGSSGGSSVSSASSYAIAADFQYEAHRRELQLGQPTVFVRNYNELVESKKSLLLQAAGDSGDGGDGPGAGGGAVAANTTTVGSGLTVDEINAKLTLHSPRSFLEALLQQLHQDVEAVKSKGPSEAWRRAAQTKGVLRALQGLVLQQPALAERILQLNRFPLILSVLAPNFSDAAELQLEAVRGLCASAASVPRCGDSIGGAAVSYVPYLFSKLEGLAKGGGGGVDNVAVDLGAASLQLLGCICRVPACSDSLAKAADPLSLATLVRALARRQPSALQLLLCTLLPPLSRHTAATATFSQRALGAHLIAALLDLLCGKAAADTKQHAARLLAALGGNPSGGNAIRAELEKVEVWSHYGKIPPSNTGNDIARLQREMGMLGRFDPSKADQIGSNGGANTAAAAAATGTSATERARLRLLLNIRTMMLADNSSDGGGGRPIGLMLRTRRARLGPAPLPYAPLLQPGLLAKEAEHEAKMEEMEKSTGHLRKAKQDLQVQENALRRTREEQERSARLVREQEEQQRQQKEKEDYERYHREQQQSYLRQAQQDQALLRSAVAPVVEPSAVEPPAITIPTEPPAAPVPVGPSMHDDDDDDAEQQRRELERMRVRQAEKQAVMEAERLEVQRKLALATAAAEQDRRKADEDARKSREEEERRREWDQQQQLERQAQAEAQLRAETRAQEDAQAKARQEAEAQAQTEKEAAAAVAAAAPAQPVGGGFDLLARMEAKEQRPVSPAAAGAGGGTFDLLAAVASKGPSPAPTDGAPFDLLARLGSQEPPSAATASEPAPAPAPQTFDLLATIDARSVEGSASAAVDDFLGEEQFVESSDEDTADMVL